MGSLTLILLIVCANVTILLLARAASRQQEMAVRLSLGAGRGRLLRQLLTESMLIAALAGGVSLWLAPHLPQLILTSFTEVPPEVSFQPNWRVFLYTFSIAILAGCVAGLSPALESLRFDLSKTLKPLGRGGAGPSTTRVRGILVATQLAISLALLTTAALTFRAQSHLLHLDLGYDPNHVIQTAFPLTRFGYDANTARTFYTELIQRMEAIPGVRTVSMAQELPFRGVSTRMVDVSESRDARNQKPAFFRQVSASYFAGLDVRLIRGRAFSAAEAARTLEFTPVVVSEAFARRFWPGLDPLGRQFQSEGGVKLRVIGVVADTTSLRPGEKDGPMFYEPLDPARVVDASLLVTFAGDRRAMMRTVRAQIRELDAQLLVTAETIGSTLEHETERYSMISNLAAILASLALALCVMGLYGLAAFVIARRTHEVGVRLAMGAQKSDIIRLFVESLFRPLVVGLAMGLTLAAVLAVLLAKARLLFEVTLIDPLTYGVTAAVIITVSLTAVFLPAYRAAQLDPWCSLRDE
jgi:predicted permease